MVARAALTRALSRANWASFTSSWVPSPRSNRRAAILYDSSASAEFCCCALYVASARSNSACACATSTATTSCAWASWMRATRSCAEARSTFDLVRRPSKSGHATCTPNDRSGYQPLFWHTRVGLDSVGHGLVCPQTVGNPDDDGKAVKPLLKNALIVGMKSSRAILMPSRRTSSVASAARTDERATSPCDDDTSNETAGLSAAVSSSSVSTTTVEFW